MTTKGADMKTTWVAGGAMAFAGLLAMASPAAAKDCAQLAGAALPQGKVISATLVAAGGFQPWPRRASRPCRPSAGSKRP
jgi:hypothetical protein